MWPTKTMILLIYSLLHILHGKASILESPRKERKARPVPEMLGTAAAKMTLPPLPPPLVVALNASVLAVCNISTLRRMKTYCVLLGRSRLSPRLALITERSGLN